MLEKLFQKASALTRHRNGPYIQGRESYLEHCAKEGYKARTLCRIARELLWAAHLLSVYPGFKVSFEQIMVIAKEWKPIKGFPKHKLNKRMRNKRFVSIVKRWLRFLGRLQEPVAVPMPFENLVQDFTIWSKQEKGLALSTIELRNRYIKEFLHWYHARGCPIHEMKVSDVDSFLVVCGRRGWCRVTIADCAKSIRAFLQFAGVRGWCNPLIAKGIHGPTVFSQESLPLGPPWEDVRRLLVSMETEQQRDIRDRAIVLLFATYGWRVTEVAKLKLENIDWEHDRILVNRNKSGQFQVYPLIPTVGNALIQYLKKVRPQCSFREVFITLTPPFRPLSRQGLYHITGGRMLKLGICSRHYGPHSLRHACAGHLVSEGFSLKEIGDHLGHRSSSATRIYAKVDLPRLREVAKFDLIGDIV